ncbi:type II toxin-antitoxin system HicB family antitoxin [Saccharibacter floricola]|uniref:Toxin-antitoxin systems HicB n=1 Tax=Saccharibacter floricola DSM 15669 TaxID=1123227 RepID=A0ABQ0NZQ3_9PROT|nr:type II toxin-antitoxin system HicB family antitoxin [Saccharibacter floricola]GBQ07529.1 toxin-antitoxin systems HicB [Saccharibacter floricola DSM 15669]
MKNILTVGGYKAVVAFDPETGLFRGEFLGLNGGADFYADSVEGLKTEGEASLKVFLEMCKEKGISPKRPYSGKFQVRLSPQEHARAVELAASRGLSLNQLISESLRTNEGASSPSTHPA